MHYDAFILVSGCYCILLKELVTYAQFAITPEVENTFINSHALSFNVQSRYVHPCGLVFHCPVLQIRSTLYKDCRENTYLRVLSYAKLRQMLSRIDRSHFCRGAF